MMLTLWSPPPGQSFTSRNTSVNSKKVPLVFPFVLKTFGKWPGELNLDLGGGRWDTTSDWLSKLGVKNIVVDWFNRSYEHNRMAVKSVCDGQCDTVTIANVLNVIREVEVRQHVVAQAHDALKYNGKAFFQIHEGKHAYRRSGIGRITRKNTTIFHCSLPEDIRG